MDKKVVGEKIVEDIINRYILSDEFKMDAMHYVYKRIFDEYNSLMAKCGYYFELNAFNGEGSLKPDVAEKFQTEMGTYSNERKMFRQIFERVFGYSPEYNETIPIESNIIFGKDKKQVLHG
jgi:hypothetical protein